MIVLSSSCGEMQGWDDSCRKMQGCDSCDEMQGYDDIHVVAAVKCRHAMKAAVKCRVAMIAAMKHRDVMISCSSCNETGM